MHIFFLKFHRWFCWNPGTQSFFFFFKLWWWLCKPVGSIFSLAKILPSWPLGCHLLHVHVPQQQALQQVPHVTTQSTWVMFLRTPSTKIPKQLIILSGSKADRLHSQSTQHYVQRIRGVPQPMALPNTIGHILSEGGAGGILGGLADPLQLPTQLPAGWKSRTSPYPTQSAYL